MIPVVRINGEDFIGTEYEDVVWSKIQSANPPFPDRESGPPPGGWAGPTVDGNN